MINRRADLLREFENLRDLLSADSDDNWIRGVSLIINTLSSDDPDSIQKAFKTYADMSVGKESFADYFCWDDNKDLMVQKNNELKRIKENIRWGFSTAVENP